MNDLLVLTKFRLSALVIVTTFVGFWLRRGPDWSGWLLFHTLLGSSFAAFGAAVFNQLMEIEPDSRMTRTADRPLPSGRVSPGSAFAIGWLLSAFALIHLGSKVNVEAAALTLRLDAQRIVDLGQRLTELDVDDGADDLDDLAR